MRFHHAASEILGRVIVIGSESIEPAHSGYVQFRLEAPAVARRGDRFIIRSYSPQIVIGGGVVLDPAPTKFKLHEAATRLRFLGILDTGKIEDVVAALAARGEGRGFPVNSLARYGARRAEVGLILERMQQEGRIVILEGRIFDSEVFARYERAMVELVSKLSQENPLEWGVEREELRARLGLLSSPLFDAIVEKGLKTGTLFAKGSRVRAGGDKLELSREDRSILEKLSSRIEERGFEFVMRSELAELVSSEKRLTSYLRILLEEGSIVKVMDGAYMSFSHWNKIVDAVTKRLREKGALTVADVKELFGFSRKFAVPVLECLDREGITLREGDERKAGPKLWAGGRNC